MDDKDDREFWITEIGEQKIETKRRVWSLHRNGRILTPQFENNRRRCVVDYVSIVHLPNYLASTEAYRMTQAAGIQAPGTKAIGRLFADEAIVETIKRQAPALSAWQAVVRVAFSGPDTSPRFSLEDVAPIQVDQKLLSQWRANPPAF